MYFNLKGGSENFPNRSIDCCHRISSIFTLNTASLLDCMVFESLRQMKLGLVV